MTSLIEITVAMERAVHAVEPSPPGRWAGWVVYFLEALEVDGEVSPADPRAFLEEVRDSITARLEEGRW